MRFLDSYNISMKKELAESLRNIQNNPTTGLPHNQHVVSAQVETIFMIDSLKSEIKKLNKTIAESNVKSGRLEQSNYRLQVAMLVLTGITTAIALFPFLQRLLVDFIVPALTKSTNIVFSPNLVYFTTILSASLGGLTAFLVEKKIIKDKVTISDSIQIILRDKDGNIKEIRKN